MYAKVGHVQFSAHKVNESKSELSVRGM